MGAREPRPPPPDVDGALVSPTLDWTPLSSPQARPTPNGLTAEELKRLTYRVQNAGTEVVDAKARGRALRGRRAGSSTACLRLQRLFRRAGRRGERYAVHGVCRCPVRRVVPSGHVRGGRGGRVRLRPIEVSPRVPSAWNPVGTASLSLPCPLGSLVEGLPYFASQLRLGRDGIDEFVPLPAGMSEGEASRTSGFHTLRRVVLLPATNATPFSFPLYSQKQALQRLKPELLASIQAGVAFVTRGPTK